MTTDRDMCMATAMRDRNPSAISVEEVMNRIVFAAEAEEDVLARVWGRKTPRQRTKR